MINQEKKATADILPELEKALKRPDKTLRNRMIAIAYNNGWTIENDSFVTPEGDKKCLTMKNGTLTWRPQ